MLGGARRRLGLALRLVGFSYLARGLLLLALALLGGLVQFALLLALRVFDALLVFSVLALFRAARLVFFAQFFLLRVLLFGFFASLVLGSLALLFVQFALFHFRLLQFLLALSLGLLLLFAQRGFLFLLLAQLFLELDVRGRRLGRFHLRRGRRRGHWFLLHLGNRFRRPLQYGLRRGLRRFRRQHNLL